eukprot:1254539-Rhodomonas_salina.3
MGPCVGAPCPTKFVRTPDSQSANPSFCTACAKDAVRGEAPGGNAWEEADPLGTCWVAVAVFSVVAVGRHWHRSRLVSGISCTWLSNNPPPKS